MDCCICRKLEGCLSTSKDIGTAKLRLVAQQRRDQGILSLIASSHLTPLRYHFDCYRRYTRQAAHIQPADEEERAVKRTRLSQQEVDVRKCLICQKKRWKHQLHGYSGDPSQLAASVLSFSADAYDRIMANKENNDVVLYHSDCLKKAKIIKPSESSILQSDSDVMHVASSSSSFTNTEEAKISQVITDVAAILKQELKSLKSSSSLDISLASANNIIPPLLKQFLMLLFDCDSGLSLRAMSLGQDIIAAISHIRTPKHSALATQIRHVTKSRKLVTLLNKFGHCSTYIDSLRMETAHAKQILDSFQSHGVFIPDNVDHESFIFGAADNIDFDNSGPDGKGSTHGINMILYQNVPNSQIEMDQSPIKILSSPPKSLKLGTTDLYGHISTNVTKSKVKTATPPQLPKLCEGSENSGMLIENCKEINQLWVRIRKDEADCGQIPSWSAFQGRLQSRNALPPTSLYYLPMLNEPPKDPIAVYKCLTIMNETLKKLGQVTSVIAMDQSMYADAKKLTWVYPSEFSNICLVMGGFHISMNFLGAIGNIFGSLGWSDILELSGLFSGTTLTQLVKGKPYSRCIKAHQAMYEVMSVLRLEGFKQWCSTNNTPIPVIDVACLFSTNGDPTLLSNFNATDFIESEPLKEFSKLFQQYCDELSERSANFRFWCLYLRAVDILLAHIKAERTGDWFLNVAALHEMVAVFFAADRPNYSRWLSIHLYEMDNLEQTHPNIFKEFVNGNFVVRRSISSFSSVAPDLALEQSLNKDVKTIGGLVGTSSNSNSRDRWFLTNHIRAVVTAETNRMAGIDALNISEIELATAHHSDNRYHCKLSIEWTNQILTHMMNQEINPFNVKTPEHTLRNISDGTTLPELESRRLADCFRLGAEKHKEFVHQRLVSNTIPFNHRIPRLNLNKVPGLAKSRNATIQRKEDQIAQLARLSVIAATRPDEVQKYISKELCQHPPTTFKEDGQMRKTDKSQLLHAIIDKECEAEPLRGSTEPEKTGFCVDMMVLLHQLSLEGCEDYRTLARKLWGIVLGKMRKVQANKSVLVFDSYFALSIKQQERDRRGASFSVVEFHPGNRIPKSKHWQNLLCSETNKKSLVAFLRQEWLRAEYQSLLNNHEMIVITEGLPANSTQVTKYGASELHGWATNHEEADTKVVAHCETLLFTCDTIYIYSTDTDVAILMIYYLYKWQHKAAKIMFYKNENAVLPLHKISQALGSKCQGLLALHALSGCDSTSAMYGIGKSKMLKHVEKIEFWDQLAEVGDRLNFDSQKLYPLIYSLYGCGGFSGTLNQLRFKLFAERGNFWEKLPLTDQGFDLHVRRVNYQVYIWKQSHCTQMKIPDPTSSGWQIVESKLLPIYCPMADLEQAKPLVICRCKKKCSARCTCLKYGLSCTDACSCSGECVD